MTKILIGAADLAALITKNPEVEADILRSAIPQVAEILRRKAEPAARDLSARVAQAFEEIVKRESSQYGAPLAARVVIRRFLEEECRKEAQNLVTNEARAAAKTLAEAAVREALRGFDEKLLDKVRRARDEVDGYIREAVGQETLKLLRSVKLAD